MVVGRGSTCVDTGGDGPAAAVHPRPRRAVAELAAEHPGVHGRAPRASRSTCPGFGDSEMPREDGSRSRATRAASTRSATRSGSSRRSWSATRWAASSAPSWRSRSRRGCSGSCSSPPPGSRPRTCAREPLLAARAAVGRPWRRALGARDRRRRHAGRGCAGGAAGWSSATRRSSRCRWPPSWSQRRGHARLPRRRWTRCSATRSATGCREIEVPDADRVGRATTSLVPVERRRRVRATDRRERARGDLRATPATCRCSSARARFNGCSPSSSPANREPPRGAASTASARDGALGGARHELRVLAEHAVRDASAAAARRPRRGAAISSSGRSTSSRRLVDVDRDRVAVADGRDRAAVDRLGGDVADHEAVRGAGEAAVGEQRDVVAEPLPHDRAR